MSNHTPGPYIIGKPGGPSGPFYSLVNPQGRVVAMQIPNKADAHLLQAAPDLYASLTDIIELVEMDPEANDVSTDLWAVITTAKLTLRAIEGGAA